MSIHDSVHARADGSALKVYACSDLGALPSEMVASGAWAATGSNENLREANHAAPPQVQLMERAPTVALTIADDQDGGRAFRCGVLDACGSCILSARRGLLVGLSACATRQEEAIARAQRGGSSTRADVLRTLADRIGPPPPRSWEEEYEALNLEHWRRFKLTEAESMPLKERLAQCGLDVCCCPCAVAFGGGPLACYGETTLVLYGALSQKK